MSIVSRRLSLIGNQGCFRQRKRYKKSRFCFPDARTVRPYFIRFAHEVAHVRHNQSKLCFCTHLIATFDFRLLTFDYLWSIPRKLQDFLSVGFVH